MCSAYAWEITFYWSNGIFRLEKSTIFHISKEIYVIECKFIRQLPSQFYSLSARAYSIDRNNTTVVAPVS